MVPKIITERKVKDIILNSLKKITIKELRETAKKSLIVFYKRQYKEISRISQRNTAFLLALMCLQGIKTSALKSQYLPQNPTREQAKTYLKSQGVQDANLYGVPLQKYSKDYFAKSIEPIFKRLINEQAKDPDDLSGHLTLRGKAELEVRYNHNLEMVSNLKEEGHKLVICSTHADCSERCSHWQGRVYSLDGTSGTTDDGRKYVPLEDATDIYYTTKKGKTYKNGLLGFNCRHYLVPYKSGFKFPKPNVAEERKQREITARQRELERRVIKWKTEAIEYKGINKEKYEFARQKAKEWDNVYIEYSKQNNRAYYPSRTKIFVE